MTVVTVWYIHPPQHGYTMSDAMVMNGRLTSLFRSMPIGRPILETMLFQTLTEKYQGQWVGSKGKVMQSTQYLINLLPFFHINQTESFRDISFSKYDSEKSKVVVMFELEGQCPIIHPLSNSSTHALPFHVTSIRPTIPEMWSIQCLTLKKHISEILKKKKVPKKSGHGGGNELKAYPDWDDLINTHTHLPGTLSRVVRVQW